jgi:hypothetical protein
MRRILNPKNLVLMLIFAPNKIMWKWNGPEPGTEGTWPLAGFLFDKVV